MGVLTVLLLFFGKCIHKLNRFDSSSPGTVYTRATASDAEEECQLWRSGAVGSGLPCQLPAAIPPPGLDVARQTYLYKHIREYVDDEWKDVMCPAPGTVYPLSAPSFSDAADYMSSSSSDEADVKDASPEDVCPSRRGRGRGRGGRGRDSKMDKAAGRGRGRGSKTAHAAEGPQRKRPKRK